MSSNQDDLIQRATSAPPMAEHVGASMFALNTWGSYGQDSPNKANPRIPSLNGLADPRSNAFSMQSHSDGGNGIAQPQASRQNNIAEPRPRAHPGTIGTPVHMEGGSKSVVDLIQEDFPRTPSPMFAHQQKQQQQQQHSNSYGGLNGNHRSVDDSFGSMGQLHNSMAGLSMDDRFYQMSNSSMYDLNRRPLDFPQAPQNSSYMMDSHLSLNPPNYSEMGRRNLDMQQQLYQLQRQQQQQQSSQGSRGVGGFDMSYSMGPLNQEILYNARGEPVAYGNGGLVTSRPPNLNGNAHAPPGYFPQSHDTRDGLGNSMGPPPGYFDEDRSQFRMNGNNSSNSNADLQMKPPVPPPQPPANEKKNNDVTRNNNQNSSSGPPPPQSSSSSTSSNAPVNYAAKASANIGNINTAKPVKKGWGNIVANGHSNYEGAIEFNRQTHANNSNPRNNGKNNLNGGHGNYSNNGNNHGNNNKHHGTNSNAPANTQTVASLLDEIRNSSQAKNTSNRNWDVTKLKGNVVNFCKDQHGSRFIQQKLEIASDDEKKFIFQEVLPCAKDLMIDVFGNYVIQKLFEYGNEQQRTQLLSLLLGNAIELSMQMYGCRVVQKAFEVLPPPLLVPFVKEFSGDVLECVHDQNGNHVIQKCIEIMSANSSPQGASMSPHIQFIIDAFLGQVKTLASHPYGCRVVQRVLEHCCNSQKFAVLDELLHGGVDGLVKDQYGNYVVQHIIQYGRPNDRATVVMLIRSDLFKFAQHKFASNVVEKCVQFGGQQHRSAMIDEMIAGTGPTSTLMTMIKDQYANYVIQKVIDLSDGDQLNTIALQIKENLNLVRKSTYGKHIITRLEKATGLKIDNNRSF